MDALERLEKGVGRLVGLLDQAREENGRLKAEIEYLKKRQAELTGENDSLKSAAEARRARIREALDRLRRLLARIREYDNLE
ncbi:MAG: cell division protein ZapB [Desulfovibrio sp.]|nr:cell division protein ZapB [Desulfovibrio sp.]